MTEGAALEFIQLQLIEKGGLIMLLIGVLSIVAAVIVIERLLYFRGRGADEEKLVKGLSDTLERGLLDQAKGVCDQFHTPLSSLISVGIAHVRERNVSAQELREFLLENASTEIPKEERFLSSLGTIAHIAPLLGLLGTVTGNIRAFGVLGELGAITDPALLSRGISEALLTTAAGIIVSIPAIIFYNFLVNKVNHRIIRLESRVSELASMLVAAHKAAGSVPPSMRNGNGVIHAAAPPEGPVESAADRAAAKTGHLEQVPVHAATGHGTPGAAHPGLVPVVAQAAPAPVEPPPARPEPAPLMQPVLAPHAGLAPHVETAPVHAAGVPGHHPAPPAFSAQAAAAAGRFEGLQPAPAPSHVTAVPVHAAAVPSQFEAVAPSAATVSTHPQAHAVPTRVAAVPAHIEAVPAT